MQISAVLRTLFRLGNERAFHVDAHKRRVITLRLIGCGGFGNLCQLVLRIGHSRRTDGGHADLCLILCQCGDSLMRAVAEIAAHAAVKMQIDQSGHGVQTAHIHRIRAHLCGCQSGRPRWTVRRF